MNKCIVCKSKDIDKIIRNSIPMFECETCSLVWRREFDVDISHYENNKVELGKEKLESRIRNVNDRIKLISKYINPNDLCDIGTGEGTFLLELKKKGYKNTIGIEPNKEAVVFAKSRGLKVFEGTFGKVAEIIRENNIHTVTLFHVIEHLENPRDVIEILYNCLSVGDYIIIETPNAKAYSVLRVKYQHPLVYPEHFFYFDTKNLTQLLEDVGFHVVLKEKRDFDQNNISIHKLLLKLGVGKTSVNSIESNDKGIALLKNYITKTSVSRTLLRKILRHLVHVLGRSDYIWIIAQK